MMSVPLMNIIHMVLNMKNKCKNQNLKINKFKKPIFDFLNLKLDKYRMESETNAANQVVDETPNTVQDAPPPTPNVMPPPPSATEVGAQESN